MKQFFTTLLASFLGLMGCQESNSEVEIQSYRIEGDTIELSESSNILSRIRIQTLTKQPFSLEIITSGTVKAIPNQYAVIAPPFEGRVLKSFVKLGQKVEPGSPIFELSSPDYFNAQREYFDAKQRFKQAELNLKRQEDLLKNGVGVQRELEVAETDYQTQKSALNNAAAALKIFNVDTEKVVLGQPLIVGSPISGEVVDNKIVLGQYLKQDAEPIVIVAELSKVWVVGQIKEKDLRFIHPFDRVEIHSYAFPDIVVMGKIYHVNELVDEETRSVQLLIECENKERYLKPGMYVTVHFIDAPEPTLLIPGTAVLQMNDNQLVFVQIGNNRFQKRKITTAGTKNGKIVVESGLNAGEKIVSEGGVYLLGIK